MNIMKHFFVLLFISAIILGSGCMGSDEPVQTMIDEEQYNKWQKSSSNVILNDYVSINEAINEEDTTKLYNAGIELKTDSEKYTNELNNFILPESLEATGSEYLEFLKISTDVGKFTEMNAEVIDLNDFEKGLTVIISNSGYTIPASALEDNIDGEYISQIEILEGLTQSTE